MQRAGLYLLSPANLSGFELRWTVDSGRHRTWDAACNRRTEQSGTKTFISTSSVQSTPMISIDLHASFTFIHLFGG